MPVNKEVLAIGCHPDDIEEFCGGTLLLLKEAGYGLTLAVMTQGESGSRVASAEEIAKIRDHEAREAAIALGAKYINLGLSDEKVEVNPDNTRKLVKVIREVKPQIILTHPVIDYMSDHENTGRLVLEAGPAAKHPNYEADTTASAIDRLPYLYHWDPQDLKLPTGQYAPIGTIVDISSVIEDKLAAFAKHSSQMGFSEHRKTSDVVEKARLWGRIRGLQVGVSYGEGLNQQLMAGYPTRNILAEALGIDKVYSLR